MSARAAGGGLQSRSPVRAADQPLTAFEHRRVKLIWALLLGSLAGAGHGLLRLALRRTGPFPYAPSMLLGAYLAVGAAWAG